MHMETTTQKLANTFSSMKGSFAYSSPMQAPRVTKVVVSTGIGGLKDKKRGEFIAGRLSKITGQAPALRTAKKSIANFKSREGDPMGYQVTLRGKRMTSFLDKLIHVVFPRVKDFRGVKVSSIDEMGNITVGFKEHVVFPETADEDSKDVFGLAVTITTTAKTRAEAEAFLRHLGFPLQEAK